MLMVMLMLMALLQLLRFSDAVTKDSMRPSPVLMKSGAMRKKWAWVDGAIFTKGTLYDSMGKHVFDVFEFFASKILKCPVFNVFAYLSFSSKFCALYLTYLAYLIFLKILKCPVFRVKYAKYGALWNLEKQSQIHNYAKYGPLWNFVEEKLKISNT